MKRIIRLTEGDLHRVIKESVKKTLNELSDKKIQDAMDKTRIDFWDAKRSGDDKRAARRWRQAGVFSQATPEGRWRKIWNNAIKEAGLKNAGDILVADFANPSLRKKYGDTNVPIDSVKNKMNDVEHPTSEDVLKAFEKAADEINNKHDLFRNHQAEYENACDYLYYGYGFDKWFKSCEGSMSREEAKIIWKAAFNKMANAD
jgi:hypothetical protein